MDASGPCRALCIKIAVKDEDGICSSFTQMGEGPKCEAVVQDKLGADDTSENAGMLSKSFSFVVRYWTRFVLAAVLIVLIVLVSVKGVTVFGDILRFFQKQNNWVGWLCFTALYCVNVAFFLPGLVLILGAGFVFRFWKGFLSVWIGGGIGQVFAFLLARYLVQDSVSVLVKGKWRKWEIIDKAIEQEGWKLLILLRLSPIVPYNLLNITMAATKINVLPFAVASFFGIIPECALVCYMGSLATDLTQIISGQAGPHGKLSYILAGVTACFMLGSAIWATLFVRRAMRRAEANLRANSDGDLEQGRPEEAGMDLSTHGLEAHHLQEDYVAQSQDVTRWQSHQDHHHSSQRETEKPSRLLQTLALVSIPGLGSPGTTKHLMIDALRGSIVEGNGQEASTRRITPDASLLSSRSNSGSWDHR